MWSKCPPVPQQKAPKLEFEMIKVKKPDGTVVKVKRSIKYKKAAAAAPDTNPGIAYLELHREGIY
jgi:hypothetical protein